jgi:hypothetical protein
VLRGVEPVRVAGGRCSAARASGVLGPRVHGVAKLPAQVRLRLALVEGRDRGRPVLALAGVGRVGDAIVMRVGELAGVQGIGGVRVVRGCWSRPAPRGLDPAVQWGAAMTSADSAGR